jgi:hypothetical protein
MNLGDAEDKTLQYFDHQGFSIEEWPFLDPSLEWRPRARVVRVRRGHQSDAAIIVRENCHSYREPHNWQPLIEARQKLPDLAIYFVVPEVQDLNPLFNELVEIGVGLYVIKPNGDLERVLQDRIPFDDLVISYGIDPNKPYRNRQNVLKVLAHSENHIWWLDKHFTVVGLDYLSHYLMNWPNRKPISEVKILGSNLISRAEMNMLRSGFTDFRREVTRLGITAEARLITDRRILRQLHDRYIISEGIAFNVLPTQSLALGQRGSLILEEHPPDFQSLWRSASGL